MDDEERKRKLEAGKAKLANYRKKKSSSKKKEHGTPLSTPRDGSHSDEIEPCDSTAVETGDDSSLLALTPSDESERSTTTADDISTEEETGYAFQLSPIERIQELELTVSDQQAALQKLTLENKMLREKNTATLAERALAERDTVINELRESVSQSAQHVRNLQQQLTRATSAVIDSGGQQDQIVAELSDTRQKLDAYQTAIVRQEEVLQQMAQKLEEKSLEAVEAAERCHSLQVELDKSQSQLVSSQQHVSDAIRSMQEEFQREKSALKAELDQIHKEEIVELRKEHALALEEEFKKRKLMEEKHSAAYDPEDARAYREQAELLRSQLETAYRDIDKLNRDHDKEVIELNQQLVNSVDEYETKLQDERATCEDFEQRLDMADTVSSEIQVSFSKQLQQLEEERDLMRQQLRQSQTQVKENSNSKTKITSLEDEVLSYQTELAQISQRLEEVEKQKRQFRDDMERAQEALLMTKNEKSDLETMNQELNEKISEQNSICEELKNKIENLNKDQDETTAVHEHEISEFQKQIAELLQTADDAQSKMNDEIKSLNKEHSEELKNLHSQHHRQMDELKQEMEKQLEATQCGLDEARKEQLETVKDVHERSRDREFARLQETHEAAIRELEDNHVKEIEAVKTEAQEVKQIAEERLRIELKEEFVGVLENELSTLRRSSEREFDLSQAELAEKHRDEIKQLKTNHEEELSNHLETELEKQKSVYEELLVDQKSQLDKAVEKMKFEFDEAQEVMANEHAESLAKIESEVELINEREEKRSTHSNEIIDKLEADLKDKTEENDMLTKKIVNHEERLKSQINQTEEQFKSNLDSQQAVIFREKEKLEEKLDELQEELVTVQTERDDIFNQAEESQKRLAALHHEDTTRMQEEMDQREADYQEKVEQMQYEIESLRASRGDLQELRKQLETRNASVEEMSRIHEEFAEEKQKLLQEIKKHEDIRETMEQDYDEKMDKLKQDHHEAIEKEQERLTQLLQDLEEHKEKLDEMTSSAIPLESSPMRSLSQMSDYDSANVAALNKDYRSAMTLTHVSGVSGLSEALEPTDEEPNSELIEQLESLKKDLEEMQAESERQKEEYEQALSDMKELHDEKIDELNELSEKKSSEMEGIHCDEISQAEEKHETEMKDLKESHQKEKMQIHMQCAADTAKQIEEETSAIRQQINQDFESKVEEIKQQMELESNDKLEAEKLKHGEELVQQTNELSQSMEIRISAVMGELHEQKQEALQKASLEHDKELAALKEVFDQKLDDAIKKEEALSLAWKEREESLENLVEDLKSEIEKSKEEYRNLLNGLNSGSNEYLIALQSKHEEDFEKQRIRLTHEHEERQEKALQKQADTYENAQSEFMKLHKEQFHKIVAAQKKDSEEKESETNKRIEEVRKQVMTEWDVDKEAVIIAHTEEMRVVATKLLQVEAEKEKAENAKNNLIAQIDGLQSQHQQEIADMKTDLVNEHMMKFQDVTVNLDQLHKEEMEGVREQHHEKVKSLRAEIDSYQELVDGLEGELRKEREQLENRVPSDEVERKLKDQIENHDEEIKKIQAEHDAQLHQIDEEIVKQASEYEESLQKIVSSQSGDLSELRQQFDDALKEAVEAGNAETQKKQERISELEADLRGMDQLRTELEETRKRKEELSAVIEEWKLKIQAWEEDRNEEREAYETKLNELSESLNNLKEEYKDLNARIEFERVEYETELENAQEETRNKEENIKELTAEIEHKNAALESLVRQHEQLTERQERENTEGENLVKILRDDLERINKERDAMHASNEHLLSVLSDLVRSNQKCEEIIAKRLENLPIMNSGETRQQKQGPSAAAEGADSDSSNSPPATSLSGSFVDEGLDLSQRFSESMFTGPELDSAARDVITSAGSRVGQATERLLDMLDSTIRKLNSSQHAQTLLSNELERVIAQKQEEGEEPKNDDVICQQEALQAHTTRISELEKIISDLEQQLQDAAAKKDEDLAAKDEEISREFAKLKEEKSLLQKQREAMTEGRGTAEIQLLQTAEELSREKSLLMDQHQQERNRLTETARALEEATEKQAKAYEEKENEYLAQIEDLNSQIACLQKRTESRSRFTAELTEDRELERDQFERAMEEMRNEIDQVRDAAKSEALLAQKVAHLEEELDAKLKSEDDNLVEFEKLRENLKQKENLITDLQEHVKSQQAHDNSSDQLDLQAQLEESRKQEEVLQKELYDTMLRISALEAQLDRYRHGLDEDAIEALEKSEAEERRMKEFAQQEVEAKEQEVEVLVEQQDALRKQIIEKEEEVERLLQEMDETDDLKAENNLLKESLEKLKSQVNEQPVSKSDQMEALSQQLLDDKNAEIDDLRQQLTLLQSDDIDANYQQVMMSLQAQLHELEDENQRLKEEIKLIQEGMEQSLSSILPEDVAVVEEAIQKSSASQEDTGIQDLSVTDLTRSEIVPASSPEVNTLPVDPNKLVEENNILHRQLLEAKTEASNLLLRIEQENILKASPEIKEKIRDVEEILEKYDVSVEEPQREDPEEELMEDIALTNRLLSEKLDEIEVELRAHPTTVLGRILNSKHNAIREKQQLIEELENKLSEKQHLPEAIQIRDDVTDTQDSSSESEVEESPESSVSEKSDENSDASHNEELLQLKNLLSEKEDAILKRDVTVAKQQDLINEKDNRLSELTSEREELNNRLNELIGELYERNGELEETKIHEESLTLENSGLREIVEKMQQDLNIKSKNDLAAEELNRLSKQLTDVQKEYASLLEDNQKLDREKCAMENESSEKSEIIEQLETNVKNVLGEQKAKIVKAEKKELILLEKIQSLNEELQEIKKEAVQSEKAKKEIEVEYEKLRGQGDISLQADPSNQPVQIMHAGGDDMKTKASHILTPVAEESSIEIQRLLHENECLKEEISNFTFKTEELQIELDLLKQSHVTEGNSVIGQTDSDVDQLQHMYESTRIEPPQTRKFSSGSSSSETVHEQIEELKKEYQKKIEEIKNTFAQELEEAVTRAALEQESLDQRKLTELEEKHRQEITELLSESGIGDNELAQRLRNELDLADKLDHELINQLTSATQKNVQLLDSEPESISFASPEKDAEISTRLQHLLSRLHNEGVQVLSLSELQFLKQHQPNKNVSMNTDPQESIPTASVDVESLRRAWENEKLALLDAIQALKELLTQTATDSAQLTDDDENLRWRGELLRSVADLFEREKHALLAELRSSVIEAQGETEEPSATSRLESLERKIRSQEMQHRSELERLLAADRDQLVDDVKQLKAERKEKLEQAQCRIEQLQELNRVAEENGKIAVKHLQSEVQCLKGKLDQEQALTSDLSTSLHLEKQRSCDLLPALEKERQRTLELSTEIASMGEDSSKELKQTKDENETLRSKLAEYDRKLEDLWRECDTRQNALIISKQQQDQDREKDQELISNLRNTLAHEETIRADIEKALRNEKNKVNQLKLDVASERGRMYEEVTQWKNRCDELSNAVQGEQGRCEKLQSALEREASLARRVRLELDNERKVTSEARDHERATIADLQAILEDAKQETEKVQRRVEVTEQDRDNAIRKADQERSFLERRLEQEKESREEVLDRERVARIELQTALDTEKIRKEEVQKRIQELEKQHREMLKNQEITPAKNTDSLLSSRRQLESLRQRLQLEASKFQNLVGRASGKPSPRAHHDSVSPSSSLLSSDGEKFESLKRSLQDMQGELKDLYSELSLPQRASESRSARPIEYNDRLLKQNAELAQFAADATKETRELRAVVDELHHQQRRPRVTGEDEPQASSDNNQQKMANRIHKLYTRYLRAESFRKSLIYQKKYLLLLLGGFQDCEEATLAMIARMGAYPSDDALRRNVTNRSAAFTKFRSAARVVIAVCRLKYLVRKWKRANNTVSAAIQNKHGIAVAPLAAMNGAGTSHDNEPSPSPSPRLDYLGNELRHSGEHHQPVTSYSPRHRYPNDPPSHDTSPFTSTSHVRASVSPYSPHVSSYGYSRDRPYTGDYRRYSPVPAHSYSAMDRSNPADTDPSLNDYIQKLENIQTKLRYPR